MGQFLLISAPQIACLQPGAEEEEEGEEQVKWAGPRGGIRGGAT